MESANGESRYGKAGGAEARGACNENAKADNRQDPVCQPRRAGKDEVGMVHVHFANDQKGQQQQDTRRAHVKPGPNTGQENTQLGSFQFPVTRPGLAALALFGILVIVVIIILIPADARGASPAAFLVVHYVAASAFGAAQFLIRLGFQENDVFFLRRQRLSRGGGLTGRRFGNDRPRIGNKEGQTAGRTKAFIARQLLFYAKDLAAVFVRAPDLDCHQRFPCSNAEPGEEKSRFWTLKKIRTRTFCQRSVVWLGVLLMSTIDRRIGNPDGPYSFTDHSASPSPSTWRQRNQKNPDPLAP